MQWRRRSASPSASPPPGPPPSGCCRSGPESCLRQGRYVLRRHSSDAYDGQGETLAAHSVHEAPVSFESQGRGQPGGVLGSGEAERAAADVVRPARGMQADVLQSVGGASDDEWSAPDGRRPLRTHVPVPRGHRESGRPRTACKGAGPLRRRHGPHPPGHPSCAAVSSGSRLRGRCAPSRGRRGSP